MSIKKNFEQPVLALRAKKLGVVALATCWIPFIGLVFAFWGGITGLIALRKVNENIYAESARQTSREGIIYSVAALILFPVLLILVGTLMLLGIIIF